jgi:hypothetical protein
MIAPDEFFVREVITMQDGVVTVHAVGNPLMSDSTLTYVEAVRRDPAVIAELPEVKALIAAAIQRAANLCRLLGDKHEWIDGAEALDLADSEILALIDTDHAAALEAVKAQAREDAATLVAGCMWGAYWRLGRKDVTPQTLAAAIRAGKVQP